ncbi:MAG TPA: GAF domain-containing sensor histidine kinase [Anaerolineae bacterium]
MDQSAITANSTTVTYEPRWRAVVARAGWLALTLLVVALTVAGIPGYFARLVASYDQSLARLGLSPEAYAGYVVALTVLVVVGHVLVAAAIFWGRPEERVARFVAVTLVANGALLPLSLFYAGAGLAPVWRWLLGLVVYLALVTGMTTLFIFPDGRFTPRWLRFPVLAWAILHLPAWLLPASPLAVPNWPAGWQLLMLLTGAGLGTWAQFNRYRHVSDEAQKQQTRWAALGLLAALAGPFFYFIPFVILPAVVVPQVPNLFRQRLGLAFFTLPVYLRFAGLTAFRLLTLLFPISFAVAILRHRLWQIDFLINRTLVYTGLTGLVVGLYVLVVGGLGVLLPVPDNTILAVTATGLVAVLFQPVRARLQGRVNRLMYGERDDPMTVLGRLGQKLEATAEPEALLPALVENVGQALKLPYTAVAIRQEEGFVATAAYEPVSFTWEAEVLPLTYRSELVGQLLAAPRSPGEAFTPLERRLLATIARQAGTAVYAVKLTADLRHSQARLMAARAAERQRLRRDLHDGLGPALASLSLKIDAAHNYLNHEPDMTGQLLQEFKQQTQAIIGDIRHIVNDLRPPALDQLGLVSALREYISMHNGCDGLQITMDAPAALPLLPAAVEVAAYHIALEAITNVVHHASASTCTLTLRLNDGLELDVRDDGRGLPATDESGVGLSSMRERAAELGGTLLVESLAGSGTVVRAHLPC